MAKKYAQNAQNISPFLSGRKSLAENAASDFPNVNLPLQEDLSPENQPPQFQGWDMREPEAQSPTSNVQSPPPTFTNEKSREELLSEVMSGALSGNPYFDKIRENQTKLIALRAMPTYTNDKGEVKEGMKDKDGRLQSGLKALVARLATMGSTPDWNSLLSGAAGAASAGIAGAIAPEWNEWAERSRQMQTLSQENEQLLEFGQRDWQFRKEQAALGLNIDKEQARREQFETREDRLNRQLDDRVGRNKIMNLRDEQKMLLEPIFKRGYFYEEDTDDATKAKMRELGIVLSDFDNRHKPKQINGQWMEYNPETRSFEPSKGTPVDPDEVPMTFMVDGEKITASAKHFLNYKAGMERQEKQQQFTASENEKNRQASRERFLTGLKLRVEQDARRGAFDRAKLLLQAKKDLEMGDIDRETYDEIVNIANNN